jgi:hypothetical protein
MPQTREERDAEVVRQAKAELAALHYDQGGEMDAAWARQAALIADDGAGRTIRRVLKLVVIGVIVGVLGYVIVGIARLYLLAG